MVWTAPGGGLKHVNAPKTHSRAEILSYQVKLTQADVGRQHPDTGEMTKPPKPGRTTPK